MCHVIFYEKGVRRENNADTANWTRLRPSRPIIDAQQYEYTTIPHLGNVNKSLHMSCDLLRE